jgi:phospholipase/carboxylesterase
MLETDFISATREISPRLMVVLHGLGDSMEGYRWLPEAMELPWMSYLLVNAPDPYFGGFAWYDLDGDSGPGIKRSDALLFELLDQTRARGFPSEKTMVFGFSQGCLLSIELGARYPHRLAGIIGVSGYVHQPEELIQEFSPAARQQRFLITHGTQDPLIPISRVRPQMEMLRQAGLKMDWREFPKAHTIAASAELPLFRSFASDCYA